MYHKKHEKGQAIILIAFAIVGLIGLTALTVDGGMAYSDRRNAQNAADNSVYAAARSKVRNNTNWKTDALNLASTNGYPDTDAGSATSNPRANVEVYTCAETGNTCPAPYAGNATYLQVVITSTINTMFAQVIGVRTVTNRVYSIANADAGYQGSIVNQSTLAGLKPTNSCNGNDDPPLTFGGSGNSNGQNGGQLVTVGSGVFSNSNSACSIVFQGNSDTTVDGCYSMAGNYDTIGNSTTSSNCKTTSIAQQPAIPPYLPSPICTGPAVKTGNTLSGGTVSGNFPPSGVTNLNSGIYCVTGDFDMSGGSLTGNGVIIVMNGGDIKISGGTINISAPTSGPFPNLLLYSPPPPADTPDGDRAIMDVQGDPLLTFTGTTLLPGMNVSFSGSSRWCTIVNGNCTPTPSQIIAWTIWITGSAEVKMLYDPTQLWVPDVPPTVNLAK